MSTLEKDGVTLYVEFLQEEYNKLQDKRRAYYSAPISLRNVNSSEIVYDIKRSTEIIETLRKLDGISDENWVKFMKTDGPCNLIF